MTRGPPPPPPNAIVRAVPYVLPVAALIFAASGFVYTMKWEEARGESPCVDCHRQKQIAEEIYFNKRPEKSMEQRQSRAL